MPPRQSTAPGPTTWVPPLALAVFSAALIFFSANSTGTGPIIWYLLVAYTSLRHRKESWVPVFFVPSTIFFGLWFAQAAAGIVLPLVVGFLAAYLLDPLVDKLEGKLGRVGGILLIALPLMGMLITSVILLMPLALHEFTQLAGRIPELRAPLEELWATIGLQLEKIGIHMDSTDLGAQLLPWLDEFGRKAGAGAGQLWVGVRGMLDLAAFLVITPVIGFYLLKDFDSLLADGAGRLKPEQRALAADFLGKVDKAISGYLRAQMLVGLLLGGLLWLAMTIAGLDYALLVGLLAVALNLVPFVGSFLTGALVVTAALLTDATATSAGIGLGIYLGLQALEQVISSRIQGDQLQLHPVVVMLAILIGGQFFGFLGILTAVPAAAVLKESFLRWAPELLELLPTVEEDES